MWRTCRKCEGRWFQGGTTTSPKCPTCLQKRRERKIQHKLHRRKYAPRSVIINRSGKIVQIYRDRPEITCRFCKIVVSVPRANQVLCDNCKYAQPKHKKATSCEGCGESFWGRKDTRNSLHKFCSDSCKEMLREHHNCIWCGDWIQPEKPIHTKYCNKHICKIKFDKVKQMRNDRDGKGSVFTPQMRYDILKREGAGEFILKEFRRDIK